MYRHCTSQKHFMYQNHGSDEEKCRGESAQDRPRVYVLLVEFSLVIKCLKWSYRTRHFALFLVARCEQGCNFEGERLRLGLFQVWIPR